MMIRIRTRCNLLLYIFSTGAEPFEPKFGHVRQLNTFC
jgi:hypothetical protein